MNYNKEFTPRRGDRVSFLYTSAMMWKGRVVSYDDTYVIIKRNYTHYKERICNVYFRGECPKLLFWQL